VSWYVDKFQATPSEHLHLSVDQMYQATNAAGHICSGRLGAILAASILDYLGSVSSEITRIS